MAKADSKIKEKAVKKVEKKAKSTKKGYFKELRHEIKLVKWPTFGEVMKYTFATIIVCLIVVVFFILLNLFMSWLKGVFI